MDLVASSFTQIFYHNLQERLGSLRSELLLLCDDESTKKHEEDVGKILHSFSELQINVEKNIAELQGTLHKQMSRCGESIMEGMESRLLAMNQHLTHLSLSIEENKRTLEVYEQSSQNTSHARELHVCAEVDKIRESVTMVKSEGENCESKQLVNLFFSGFTLHSGHVQAIAEVSAQVTRRGGSLAESG